MCPYLDRSDPRCAAHLNLRNIQQAYAHCADDYTDCPVFRQRLREAHAHEVQRSATVLAPA